MSNGKPSVVVCHSRSEIYARLTWLLQPLLYKKYGPAALITFEGDLDPWLRSEDPTSPRSETDDDEPADTKAASSPSDPFAKTALLLQANGEDPMAALLHKIVTSIGDERDLLCLLDDGVYGVLRAPITAPAEAEAFAHHFMEELASLTSIPLWSGVAVSSFGDTPGVLMTHSLHTLSQAKQLGSGQIAIFDEVDRTVLQMQEAEDSEKPRANDERKETVGADNSDREENDGADKIVEDGDGESCVVKSADGS